VDVLPKHDLERRFHAGLAPDADVPAVAFDDRLERIRIK